MTGLNIKNIIKIIAFCLGSLNCLCVKAQKFTFSEPLEAYYSEEEMLIGSFEDSVYFYQKEENQINLYAFSDSLSYLWKKQIKFKRKPTLLNVLMIQENIYTLCVYHLNNMTYLELIETDIKDRTNDKSEIQIFDAQVNMSDLYWSRSKNNKFLIFFHAKEDRLIEMTKVNIESKQLEGSKNIYLNNSFQKHFDQLYLRNNGAFDLVFIFDNNKKNKKSNHVQVISYDAFFKVNEELNIPMHDLLFDELNIFFDEMNQQLAIFGFYAPNSTLYHEGIFCFKKDASGKTKLQFNAFEESFFRKMTGTKKKRVKGFNNFKIVDQIALKGGGLLIIAEQKFAYQASSFYDDGKEIKKPVEYLHNNILLCSMHPNGKIFWKNLLFKQQESTDESVEFSSFFIFKTASQLNFIYNENIYLDSPVYAYGVNHLGSAERKMIRQQNLKEGLQFLIRNSIQTSLNEMYILAKREKKISLVKINF